MPGLTDCKNFESHTDAFEKTTADDWREGGAFSFLVDFKMDNGNTLRVFIQTSSCSPPNGFPSVDDLREKPIDLAIICVASHAYAKKYPRALLSHIKPKQTILVHWENFLSESMYVDDPKNVALTRLAPFMRKMKKHYKVDLNKLKDSIVMPRPLTCIEVKY